MNRRIKELYTKAYCMAFDEADDKNFLDHHMEKFAELIVKECIERGNDLAKHYINNHSEQRQVFLLAAIADYSNEIEKHFGVEK